jgi:hypothetical protein
LEFNFFPFRHGIFSHGISQLYYREETTAEVATQRRKVGKVGKVGHTSCMIASNDYTTVKQFKKDNFDWYRQKQQHQ